MSMYASDRLFHDEHANGTPYIDGTFIDVAADCLGVDVRIIVDGRSIYLTPEQADGFSDAIKRCAAETLHWRSEAQR